MLLPLLEKKNNEVTWRATFLAFNDYPNLMTWYSRTAIAVNKLWNFLEMLQKLRRKEKKSHRVKCLRVMVHWFMIEREKNRNTCVVFLSKIWYGKMFISVEKSRPNEAYFKDFVAATKLISWREKNRLEKVSITWKSNAQTSLVVNASFILFTDKNLNENINKFSVWIEFFAACEKCKTKAAYWYTL